VSPAFHVRLDQFALAQAPDVVVVFSIVVQGGSMGLFLHRFSGAEKPLS
jgi:hypothetical protein